MTQKSDTPRVYIACLACYNEGKHNGAWIDATDADEMQELIDRLAASLCPECGEELRLHLQPCSATHHEDSGCGHVGADWAIHDHEGFHGVNIGENPSLSELASLASNIEEHGEAFAFYVNHVGSDWDDVSGFQEAYAGDFSDKRDPQEAYAEELATDIGAYDPEAGWPLNCIDWERATRDLFCGDYWEESGHIFRSI